MGNYSFHDDLEGIGGQGEKHVALDLIAEGAKLISDNNDKLYDLKMLMPNGSEVLIEVKTDDYCKPGKDTGNMFIEFECRGKESGISVTISDYFVYYYPHLKEIWYIKTVNLKKILNENDIRTTQFSGDVGSNTKGYLLPRKWYQNHFKVRKVDFKWQS